MEQFLPDILKYILAALVAGNLFFIKELVRKMNRTYDAVIRLASRVEFLEKSIDNINREDRHRRGQGNGKDYSEDYFGPDEDNGRNGE